MIKLVSGDSHGLSDVEQFIADLQQLSGRIADARFEAGQEIVVARAPGRLDVMGGVADYSGSLVLQWPTREAVLAAVQTSTSTEIRIVSEGRREAFVMSLAELVSDDDTPVHYEVAQRRFEAKPDESWAAYVAGCFLVLMRERAVHFTSGATIYLRSDVPEGKGVSSSAALEVATMTALAAAFRLTLLPGEVARLCQVVENRVVGAACGIMDQMAVACGESNRLMALVCQPAHIVDSIPLPEDVRVWGIDSGERHAVSGSPYTNARIGAFMGYRIIAEREGLRVSTGRAGTVRVEDPKWNGYLCNMLPPDFETKHQAFLPETMDGASFLRQYGGLTDDVVRIDSGEVYPVRAPTSHAIYENLRVHLFAAELRSPSDARSVQTLGTLMRQSHHSYGQCGLGSERTDLIVQLVDEAAAPGELAGGRITGGGSGGTVAVVGHPDAEGRLEEVVARFSEATGHTPHVFRGGSPGAGQLGVIRLAVQE